MQTCLKFFVLMILAAALAACQASDTVSITDDTVTLHASGQPAATLDANGELRIDGEAATLAAPQRQLLARYHDKVIAIHAQTEALKHAGLDMAGDGIGMAWQSIKDSISGGDATAADAQTDQAMQLKAKEIARQAEQLCTAFHETVRLQKSAADRVPAFAPYADINPAPHVNCGPLGAGFQPGQAASAAPEQTSARPGSSRAHGIGHDG